MNSEMKRADYFSHMRSDIVDMLPKHASRVLEIGCGNGETLRWMKQNGRCDHATGVEIDSDAFQNASQHLDRAFHGDFEILELPLTAGEFDLVMCLDVLEHMRDPWKALERLYDYLRPGGTLIVSLPNVRHYSVVYSLLLKGDWRYQEAGILDKTHLRFFTKRSSQELVNGAGFVVSGMKALGIESNRKAAVLNVLTFGLIRQLFDYQYVILAKKQ